MKLTTTTNRTVDVEPLHIYPDEYCDAKKHYRINGEGLAYVVHKCPVGYKPKPQQ